MSDVTSQMSKAQVAALKWLINRGGDGVFTKHQTLLVRGHTAPILRSTWNSLAALGLVELYMNNRRIKVTEAGNNLDLSKLKESFDFVEDLEAEREFTESKNRKALGLNNPHADERDNDFYFRD